MNINSSSFFYGNNSPSYKGTLKICNYNNGDSVLSEKSVSYIENAFSELTKKNSGRMDVLLFNRNNQFHAKADKILFSDGDYTDFADTHFRNCDDQSKLLNNLVAVFNYFREIKMFKDSVKTLFKN